LWCTFGKHLLRLILAHLNVRFEAFTATECSEVFSGNQPCDNGAIVQRFGDCLCFHQPWWWRQRQSPKRWITVHSHMANRPRLLHCIFKRNFRNNIIWTGYNKYSTWLLSVKFFFISVSALNNFCLLDVLH
jgi:hypothetical protein